MQNHTTQEEDQLLHGVTMTTSISCHTHNESDHDNLSPSSHPYSLQCLADHIQLQDQHPNQNFGYFIHGHDMKETKKARTRLLYQEDMTSIRLKSNSNNAWQSVLHLDNKLFWTHQTNILGKAYALVTKVSQSILTQQYCKLKAYEKQLLQIIKQIEFSLTEYEKQKKCLVNHINLLKADNDSLYRTMLEVYAEVQQLQNSCRQYFDNSLKQYIYSNSNSKYKKVDQMSVGMVPFARTFSHNMDEINLIKIIEEEQKSVPVVPISLFAQFLLDLKKATNDISTNDSKNYSFSPKISSKFGSQSVIRQWIKEIGQNLMNLEQSKEIIHQKSIHTVSFFQEEFKPKLIEEFIETLQKNRPYILKKMAEHSQRDLYFLHIVHSSIITFLGILVKETKQCYLQLSFGDNSRNWMNNLISQLKNIRLQFNLSLNIELEEYLDNLQSFIGQINDMVVFRMQRLNQ